MVENMPALGGLAVAMALVPVQVTVSDGVVLEGTIKQAANDTEPFLR